MTTRGLTRRGFLRATGAAALTLGLANLDFALAADEAAVPPASGLPPLPPYRTWEDVYRQKWTWDRVVRGTHTMTGPCRRG